VAAVGIDVECIMPESQAQRVARTILLPEEVDRMPGGLTRAEWTTLVFSAKESLFKCLNPVVGRYFHYADAEVVGVAADTGTLKIALHRDLSARFSAGTILRGRYDIRGGLAHTAVVIAPR
jgi:enterobactin synthetase component D